MNPPNDHHEQLARVIHQTLRDLPPRRAPRSLEFRVLAEIERRAALPWWRQNFAHWPVAARAVFLVASAGIVKLVLMAVVWAMAGFDNALFASDLAPQFALLQPVVDFAGTSFGAAAAIVRNIPPLWLYAGLAFLATMYATLFGIGAAAYRILHPNR